MTNEKELPRLSTVADPDRRNNKLSLIAQAELAAAVRLLQWDRLRILIDAHKLWPGLHGNALVAAVHGVRLGLVTCTDREKQESEHWLRQNGFSDVVAAVRKRGIDPTYFEGKRNGQ